MKVLRPTSFLLADLYRVLLVIKKVLEEVAQVQGDLSSSRAFSLPDDVTGSKVTNDNHESFKFKPNLLCQNPFYATEVRLIESQFFGYKILTARFYER